MSTTDMKSLGWKILPWLMDIVCALLMAWAVQLNKQVGEIQRDVQSIKEWRAETTGNRYTARDHAVYSDTVNKEFQSIWSKFSDLQQTWLNDVSAIKVSLAQMPTRMDIKALDDRIREHEAGAAARSKIAAQQGDF